MTCNHSQNKILRRRKTDAESLLQEEDYICGLSTDRCAGIDSLSIIAKRFSTASFHNYIGCYHINCTEHKEVTSLAAHKLHLKYNIMKFVASVVTFFLATVAVGPLGSVHTQVQGFTSSPTSSSASAAVESKHSQSHSRSSSCSSCTPRAPAAFFQLRSSEVSSDTNASTKKSTSADDNPLGLTPELLKLTLAFESIGDDKLRYKQLLYMANQLKPMEESYNIPENKVPGCLSTVYIHATLDDDPSSGAKVVNYLGDSDGLLTKGLVALLVRGFSGNTAEAIQHVDPAFVKQAGIDASLTPGRNNGFLNMLVVMKNKAAELAAAAGEQSPAEVEPSTSSSNGAADVAAAPTSETPASSSSSGSPNYDAIMAGLQTELEPVKLTVVDISQKYGDDNIETHFSVEIVSDKFDKLNVIKRQKLIYASLGDVMPNIEALQIQAFTPAEVQAKEEA
jgi:sulfur transfer protein SufE/stress-induced morphogen